MRRRSVVSSFVCRPEDSLSGYTVTLFKRSNDVSTYQGKWAACSGSIEADDLSPEAAARRELNEETQLESKDLELMREGIPFTLEDEGLNTEWTVHPFAFRLKDPKKELVIDWEHTEYRFIKPEDMRNYETVPNLRRGMTRVLLGAETEAGLRELREDHTNGAEVLALKALEILLKTVHGKDLAWVTTAEDLWKELRTVAWHLAKNGRPSMSAAIESALLKALSNVSAKLEEWSGVKSQEELDVNPVALSIAKEIAEAAIKKAIHERHHYLDGLLTNFSTLITDTITKNKGRETIIVTLSHSSTITKCFTHLLSESLPTTPITLRILESRPKFEGVTFANVLLSALPPSSQNIKIELLPDSAVATALKEATLVIIGADKVAPAGEVCNKIGSLTLAIVAKALCPTSSTVAVFGTDKIVPAGQEIDTDVVECNDPAEVVEGWPPNLWTEVEATRKRNTANGGNGGLTVLNPYFEWVSPALVDGYVTERGVLTGPQVREMSVAKDALERRFFADL
jgi:translation initiation factor 2B subunit (eIF-2B alpha/beta/delta family)/8-oxo-dGTP pyrophosphatase MutT (NUDIX family)